MSRSSARPIPSVISKDAGDLLRALTELSAQPATEADAELAGHHRLGTDQEPDDEDRHVEQTDGKADRELVETDADSDAEGGGHREGVG